MTDTNIIYIGQKPMMNYVLVVGNRLGLAGSSVLIKARGMSISKAVDVALIIMDRSKGEVKLDDIGVNTEVLPGADGSPLNVSSIRISLSRS